MLGEGYTAEKCDKIVLKLTNSLRIRKRKTNQPPKHFKKP